MRGVDQRAQVVRRAVGAGRRVEEHAVVAPVPAARKIRQRHDLDGRRPEVDQHVEFVDGRTERSLRREGSDVQFVDDQFVERNGGPFVGVLPGVLTAFHHLRWPVNSLRLIARHRIGKRLPLLPVETEFVQVSRASRGVVSLEISVFNPGHRHGANHLPTRGKNDGFHALALRCPHPVTDPAAGQDGGSRRRLFDRHGEERTSAA